MRNWRKFHSLAAVPALALALAACGGNDGNSGSSATGAATGAAAATKLDCRTITVIVPYSPGGGSDQQVRRLQKALEANLDLKLNITYQTGGDGSVGWNALANAAPDGCTVANVVAPNIMNLSLQSSKEIGFKAEDMVYVGWTEYSPNMVLVGKNSKFKTINEFVDAAKANPGKVTMNGVGVTGQLLATEMMAATGIKVSYVPVSGGVGDMIPQVAGGHVDAAITGSSGLQGGQLHPLALSAPSDRFGDIPTLDEAGYPGAKLVTSWGFILPPKTPDDIAKIWNAAIEKALDDPKVKEAYAKAKFTVLRQDLAAARTYFEEQLGATKKALSAQS